LPVFAPRNVSSTIGDPSTSGLNSLNDIFFTVLGSNGLKQLVDAGLVAANPINNGGCGVFACNPDVNYNSGTVTPINTATNVAGKPIKVGASPKFIATNGKTAYVSSASKVVPISTATNTAGKPIQVGPGAPGGIAITP